MMPARDKEQVRVTKQRRWTASQIDRKRQLDREAQRTLRAKTKSRIQQLEEQVKLFQTNDTDRGLILHAQIERQQNEIQQLRDVLSTVAKAIATVPQILQEQQCQQIPSNQTSTNYHSPSSQSSEADITWSHGGSDDATTISGQCQTCAVRASSQAPTSIADFAASITKNRSLEGRLWLLAGGILNHILRNPTSPITTENDTDIPIRAVFEGWPVVMERYDLDPGWQWLKELDERIYLHSSPQDRLMHMRNVRLVFLRQYFKTSKYDDQIPAFYSAGHAERNIQHDALIEHFPWPSFRQRLLFEPTRFATNRFMDALRMNLSFPWNSDERDLYVLEGGVYRYAEEFERRMMDFRCYAARKEFFDLMPELKADIPCNMVMLRELVPYSPLPLLSEGQILEIHEELGEVMEGC